MDFDVVNLHFSIKFGKQNLHFSVLGIFQEVRFTSKTCFLRASRPQARAFCHEIAAVASLKAPDESVFGLMRFRRGRLCYFGIGPLNLLIVLTFLFGLGDEGEGGVVVGGVDLDLDGIYIVQGDVGGVLSEHCGRNAVLVEHPGGDVGAHCVAEFGDSLEIFCHNL